MSAPAARFRSLHEGRPSADGGPLVLPGPWDAASARAFADAGFAALATPSHGVSVSLGYEDGACPADEMFAAVARIVRAVEVPVTADIERGYGLPPREIVERLLETGAVGCNLEDTEDGALVGPAHQADWLAEVRAAAGPDALFLNARVDSYLRGATDPLADALERGRRYVEAGADGVYPIGAPPAHLKTLAAELPVPVNAISVPQTAPPAELGAAGAARVTFGGSLAMKTFAGVAEMAAQMAAETAAEPPG
ncbi:isocitrate lyase/phosphoenolpyruvate mutase family protein [Streptomyces albiaxialis]|uniref:Isocitrate lyase/phosphoenolpyruvate mutase family protein n=1 Tax=Streptomyces albiaxialis TaxID=329523 RepID=A0ABN2VW32_9ACTN